MARGIVASGHAEVSEAAAALLRDGGNAYDAAVAAGFAASLAELEASGRNSAAVVTEIIPAVDFFRAEEYHQKFLDKRSGQAH